MNWSKIGVGVLIVVVVALCVNWATDSFRVTNVLTDSMSPTIVAGDFVLTANDRIHPPTVGDIVMYDAKRLDGTVVARFTHRIIGQDADGWIVQGDANPEPDVQHPTEADIQGVVVARIPGIGSIQLVWVPWAIGAGALVFAAAYLLVNRRR